MTYVVKPKFHHPDLPKNELGFTHRDYEGAVSTLCAGCGHDSISASIIEACFELSIAPHRVAKLSGIGCSSKTPTYFLGNSHGFNSVHGRMPSVLTGANLANRDLIYLGVSGDGDSASIGFGQFAHALRRGVDMVYIVENNGVYGLTKGQFSATADRRLEDRSAASSTPTAPSISSASRSQSAPPSSPARSPATKKQLTPLIKAAIEHRGAAFIDVISPCVAFNNHAGSTKSFDYVREHNEAVNKLDFITGRAAIKVDYAPGTVELVQQHDGSTIALRKLDSDYDVHDRLAATSFMQHHAAKGAGRHRTALCRARSAGLARPSQHGQHAAQCARREGAVPRLGRARQVQRLACGRDALFPLRREGFAGISATAVAVRVAALPTHPWRPRSGPLPQGGEGTLRAPNFRRRRIVPADHNGAAAGETP